MGITFKKKKKKKNSSQMKKKFQTIRKSYRKVTEKTSLSEKNHLKSSSLTKKCNPKKPRNVRIRLKLKYHNPTSSKKPSIKQDHTNNQKIYLPKIKNKKQNSQ